MVPKDGKKKKKQKKKKKDNKSYNQVAFMYNMDGGGGGAPIAKKKPEDVGKWKLSEPRESNLNQKEQWVYLGLMEKFAGYTSGQPFKNSQGRHFSAFVIFILLGGAAVTWRRGLFFVL